MEEIIKNENNSNDRIILQSKYDGSYFIILLLKYKWFIIITVSIVTITSVIYSLYMPNWYSATANAVPSKTQGSFFDNVLGGGISSALKEFGMTKLGGKSSESYDFIVLLQSRTIKDSLINKFNLAKDYDIPEYKRTNIYSTLDENFEVAYEKEGNYTIKIQSENKTKAVNMVNYVIQVVNGMAEEIAQKEASYNRHYLEYRITQTDSVIKSVSDSLSNFSKKTFLFSPEDQGKAVTSAYSDLKSELILQETMLDITRNRYGDNDAYTKMRQDLVNNLTARVDEAKNQPGFAGNFKLEDATGVGIEYMRLLAEFETFAKVKSLILPLLEEAKLEESKKSNTLIVIDNPIPADKKSKPKRSLIVLGFMFGTLIMCSIFIVLLDGFKNFKRKYSELTKTI